MLYKMNCDKRIELDLLTEEDAWIMFERYAGISNSSSNSVIHKGHEIAKECKQLPIAIAVMVRSCKGHGDRIVAWDMTLKSLKNRASIHYVDEDMAEIYKALKFSYDYITDEKAKGLFLLCSLFRENEEISIEVLTRFIIGVGLFEDNYDNYNDARNRVIVAKNELLDHYLLLEVGEKHVKMHDLVRAMAQWIANKEIQGVNLSKTNQKLFVERETNIKYLSCEGKDMDLFSCKFKGSNLETLIVKVDRDEDRKCIEVPNSFFESLVKLRVLYFLGNDERPLSLPHSICLLKNIRSMLVDSVDLGDISILGNLRSLETLDLVQCTITEFPREITKLEKLTLLKLEYCEIKRNNPFEVIERCSSLEELYFIDSFSGFCQEINFPELQIYHIRKGSAVMDDSLSKYVVFPSNDDACCFSNAKLLKYCMQTAEVLQLNGIKGEWRNLMPEIVPIHLGMDDLLELRLSCISQLQCLVDTIGSQVPTVLSKMVVLELNRMENLKELFKGTLSLDSMKNLEELSINDCKHLQSLFKCKLNLCNLKTIKLQRCPMLVSLYQLLTSRNLVLLETLKIGDCENLKNIIADERREEESIEEIHDDGSILGSLMFPKLKVVDIEGCPLLESIFPFLFVHDLPVLETIKIRRCDGLQYIFGQFQDAEFGSLRELELFQLPNFIDMFCKSNHPSSLSEKGSSFTSNNGSKAPLQLDLDPAKCKDTATTTIPLVDGDNSGKEASNPEFDHKGSSSTFNSDSKAQLQLDLDPMKCNIFSEDITTTTIPLVDGVDYSESNSYYLTIWNQAQCLQIPSKILYNIKKIELSQFSKIKSVFIPSIAPRMLVETLTIRNCDELKNIIDFGDYDSGSNTWCNVFPKLKELYIEGCPKMEYIFGQYTDDHQNQVDIRLHLLELNCLNLCNLPSLVAMCPKHYKIIFPILEKFKLSKCSQAAIKSLSHVRIHPVSESLDSTFIKEDGAGQIVITKSTTQHINGETWQEPKKTNDVQVSRNNDAFKKEGSNIVEQFPKDHYTIVSKSLVASQFPLVPSKGDPSQNVEYLTSSSLCTRELEQLVSKKHLDYENLSLLTDFLVKNPSLRLKDTSVSNRYKGCAYNLLAELLKFLQTHSVLDVLGSCRTEFVELLQDARSFGFDKDWLDDVERRALFPDIQVYQDTLQKVLDSRQQVTKDVEVLCSKTEGLTNQLTSSEAILKNISQQHATISAPIGY
ncbi:CC-NBS-LRR resistance protein [Trifolium pratense]|uniref:CC-NBS-LRR resistance protein n=1 Tax=Trifolium pratense TaxID=57577 RepID=A0A2K3NX10_TRIPR|nr:CC-NBS-LRR resistance protein [Trifolium pratense]